MEYTLFDSLFDGVVVINDRREIIYANESAARLAGVSIRRLTKNLLFSKVFRLENQDLFPVSGGSGGRDEAFALTEMEFSAPVINKNGRIQISIQPTGVGSCRSWVVLLHDVTLEATLHSKYQGELEAREHFIRQLQDAKAQLEDYSKNLEAMVAARTMDLNQANLMLRAVMDSLGQGFVVFGRDGKCTSIYTKACERVLECIPSGMNLADVLRLEKRERDELAMWIDSVFDELLPFDSLVELAPLTFNHSQGRHVVLNYYTARDENDGVAAVVMVATDQTAEQEAQKLLQRERDHVAMILKAIRNKSQIVRFASPLLERLERGRFEFSGSMVDKAALYRWLHTLEGDAATFGAWNLRDSSRRFQSGLGETLDYSHFWLDLTVSAESFLTDNAEILRLVGVGGNQFAEVQRTDLQIIWDDLKSSRWESARARYRDRLMSEPLEGQLSYLSEVSQVVAEKVGKQIAPIGFEVGDIRTREGQFEELFGSLVHIFRNAVDHGIESPGERESVGKPVAGKLVLKARLLDFDEGSWIRIEVEDDGRGIDPVRLRSKLRERFLDLDVDRLSDEDVLQQIFRPGFSSREEVGEFSGRGVGMDAVKTEVEKVGGRVWVESILGRGTKVILEFPQKLIHNEAKGREVA